MRKFLLWLLLCVCSKVLTLKIMYRFPFQFHIPSEEELQHGLKNPEVIGQFCDVILSSLEAIKSWAEKIPGFMELCPEDRDLLLQSASVELFALRLAYR